MSLSLTDHDRAMADGAEGAAVQIAMGIVIRLAEAVGAKRLIDVASAHIDSCLYHGRAGLDFAERLAAAGGRVRVPTTLNVSSLDLLHPDLYRGDAETADLARRLMQAYVDMGGRPTWTCAPYQSVERPAFGEHVAWAESNAIVFANSVLGARTARYGDFIDICAAVTGRVPDAGLHREEERLARAVFRVEGPPAGVVASGLIYPLVGHLVGARTGSLVPAITGLPADAPEDGLKALGAAAASSGGVAMFHAVGRTPEAATLEQALGGREPEIDTVIDRGLLRTALAELSPAGDGRIAAVSVGTPHASLAEMEALARLLAGRHAVVDFFVSTSREVLAAAAAAGLAETLRSSGLEIVTDTCTYITPILRDTGGVVMTDSAKWAYYAPGNLGLDVAFGSLADCVASAVAGTVTRDEGAWS